MSDNLKDALDHLDGLVEHQEVGPHGHAEELAEGRQALATIRAALAEQALPDRAGLEDWHMVPADPGAEPIPTLHFAPDDRAVTAAVLRAGRPGRFSTVVTSERHVGSIDVVGRCLLLAHDGQVITRDERPLGIKVRLAIPSGGPRTIAAGFMATATVFPTGERIGFIDCAVAMEPRSFAEGCIRLVAPYWTHHGAFLSRPEVEDIASPRGWNDDRVEFLRGLLTFDLLEVLNGAPRGALTAAPNPAREAGLRVPTFYAGAAKDGEE